MSEQRSKFALIAEQRLAAYLESKKKLAANRDATPKQRKQRTKAKKSESREVSGELRLIAQKAALHAKEKADKAIAKEVERQKRIDQKCCISCGDVSDIRPNGYCKECWIEKTTGRTPRIGVSERQFASMQCRIVRKGHEMS